MKEITSKARRIKLLKTSAKEKILKAFGGKKRHHISHNRGTRIRLDFLLEKRNKTVEQYLQVLKEKSFKSTILHSVKIPSKNKGEMTTSTPPKAERSHCPRAIGPALNKSSGWSFRQKGHDTREKSGMQKGVNSTGNN